jgi:hypothetical protein
MSKKGQSNVAAVITNTQINKVVWTKKMLEDYLDICIDEIHAGNCPGTHFNRTWMEKCDRQI